MALFESSADLCVTAAKLAEKTRFTYKQELVREWQFIYSHSARRTARLYCKQNDSANITTEAATIHDNTSL